MYAVFCRSSRWSAQSLLFRNYNRPMREIEELKSRAERMRKHRDGAFWHNGTPDSAILDAPLNNAALSSHFIALVGVFDDALIDFIQRKYGKRLGSFAERIRFLAAKGCFKDRDAVDRLRKRRNEVAHKFGTIATWDDWDHAINTVESELRHLGLP